MKTSEIQSSVEPDTEERPDSALAKSTERRRSAPPRAAGCKTGEESSCSCEQGTSSSIHGEWRRDWRIASKVAQEEG